MVPSVCHVKFFEEMGSLVFAGATVLGVRIKIEGIVTGLGEFAVSDDFLAKMRVQGV